MLGRGRGKYLLAVVGLLVAVPAKGAEAHNCNPRTLEGAGHIALGCVNPVGAEPVAQPIGGTEADQPVPGVKPFGFNQFGGTPGAQEASLGRRAGAGYQRIGIAWRWTQYCATDPVMPVEYGLTSIPDDHPHREAARYLRLVDERYAALTAAGMTPMIHVNSAPFWAWKAQQPTTCDDGKGITDYWARGAMLGAYARFVKRLAERYPLAMFDGTNEPNLFWHHDRRADGTQWTFVASPAEMTQVQCTLYETVKAVDPARVVIGPGFARLDEWTHFHQYAAGMLALGAHHCWDGFNVHLYPDADANFGPDGTVAKQLTYVRSLKSQFLDADPIWVTEAGYTTVATADHPDAVGEAQQADATRRLYNVLQSAPDVGGTIFHTLRERPDANTGFGWLDRATLPGVAMPGFPGALAFRPKPVYCQFVARAGSSYPTC